MRAAILSIGSELMQGFLTDTNATFLTQELNALGIEPISVTQVGDHLPTIVRAIQRGLADADIVITSGGIGPTDDDLTREAVAQIVGETPVVDEEIAETIRAFFRSRGGTMPEQNLKQAWVIPSADSLLNPMGTAPGWYARFDGKAIASMPGVPREMFRMFREQVVPRLMDGADQQAIVSTTLKTIGIGESAVELEVYDLIRRGTPIIATYAKDDGVHVRITAMADDYAAARAQVDAAEAEVRALIGEHVYGYLEDSLAQIVLDRLERHGRTLAVLERNSASQLAQALLTADVGDLTVVSTRSLPNGRGGAIGTPAEGARLAREFAGSIGASASTGLFIEVGPSETERKPAEITFALSIGGNIATKVSHVNMQMSEIRRRAVMQALEFLWRETQYLA